MSKKIVVFADGTGNAFSTQESNVWRLYAELDQTLPDQMLEASTTRLTIVVDPATGAQAELVAGPYYFANIAANWTEADRRQAFDYLERTGNGDLIKTQIVISYAREERADALAFLQTLQKQGLTPSFVEQVHHQTLSAWLREQYELHYATLTHPLPDLAKIGGTVGRRVQLKLKD